MSTGNQKKVISLIPGGTIQFYELNIDFRTAKRPEVKFFELETEGQDNDKATWKLNFLRKADDSDFYVDCQTGHVFHDPLTKEPVSDHSNIFSVSFEKALENFSEKWVPVPFFRTANDINAYQKRFRCGPTDWCRIRVCRLANNSDFTHKIILAFDTHIQADVSAATSDPEEGYPALSTEDVSESGEFGLASDVLHNSWFIRLEWMNDWLQDLHLSQKHGQRPRPTDFHTEHVARYITFLEFLAAVDAVPNVRLIDPRRHEAINVDLVLDIGNARTIGMLIERRAEQHLSLSNGSQLEIRDLSHPEVVYKDTFSSYVTFSEANFGDQSGYSRGAGRVKQSFSWPSVVRVGAEATKLATLSRRDQGQTSMSSPKRYLWDLKPRLAGEQWRFAPDPSDKHSPEKPVNRGDFVGYVNNEGIPLEIGNPQRYKSAVRLKTNDVFPVTEPRFSRSSMMMFLMSEILSHALVQINSPGKRAERPNPDLPRRLSRIILTTPPAMSVTERDIFESWANWAVDVVWKALEWEPYCNSTTDYRARPQVKINLDEASATQLVFIYNEIAVKFAGNATDFFKIYGKVRKGLSETESLRVASIDIGGGTTDMVITSYLNESENVTSILVPRQEFRESFNYAGDDILKLIIETHVFPTLAMNFSFGRNQFVQSEIERKFSKDAVGLSETAKNTRAQFTQQFLLPVALAIIHVMETIDPIDLDVRPLIVDFDELFGANYPNSAVLTYLEIVFSEAQRSPFSFKGKSIILNARAIERTITSAIGPYLQDLSEVVETFECDFLILSGRPTCLPSIQSFFRKHPAVGLSRIVPMSSYRIENWYPFITPEGRIGDPKTTGVVGALLSAISEGNLLNFHFRALNLKPASTIRFVGPMDLNRQIRNENLFFKQRDISKLRDGELLHTYKFAAPIYIGFRQFGAERWKTTPFYYLSFASEVSRERAIRHGMPYEIEFIYSYEQDDYEDDKTSSEKEGVFRITAITARDGTPISNSDIDVQLKSLWEQFGHWLDTGLFELN